MPLNATSRSLFKKIGGHFSALAFALIASTSLVAKETLPAGGLVEFVFTSDVHYGILRAKFRRQTAVDARVVNAALVEEINRLPSTILPSDGGLAAGRAIGAIDFLAIGGDIANRQEALPVPIQSAAVSWSQFTKDYIDSLTLKNSAGQRTPLLVVPGNHDVSDAIGAPVRMNPPRDATSLAEIYNLTMKPTVPLSAETYRFETNRIEYSRDFPGLHCIFVTIWPDSHARAWMETDLKKVPASTPVVIFCHDPPEVETRHLTNPNGNHEINGQDRFENVIVDQCADGTTTEVSSTIEQRAFVAFLKAHRNITAYFHGHSNWNEFYTWRGPDNDIALNVFRADSPMKGKVSSKDETKLSFHFVVFDPLSKQMTVRECLWNNSRDEVSATSPTAWGKFVTVDLTPPKR